MTKVRTGDRVWVKNPSLLLERKVGTIVGTKKTPQGLRYLVEWEIDLVDQPNGHHQGYRANEIVPVSAA